MDTSGSDELNTSRESNFSEEADGLSLTQADRPSPFTLRSQCCNHRCPHGAGILFRSRISPSPSKQRVRTRRRRRSDQSHLDSSTNTTLTSLTTSLDHHHVESLEQEPRPLRSNEMIRQRSMTPRRRKATTPTPEREGSSPSQEQSRDGGEASTGVNRGVTSLAETVKEKVLGFLSPTQEASLPAIVESSESGFEEGNLTGSTVPTSSPASEVFVGAREFFAEREQRDYLTSDFSSSSDTPSRLRESTRRLSIRKALNHYIAYSSDEELEEWQNQPKSDYTYSASLTYRDRVTPDRKIGSPNMSRRGLRGGNMAYMKSPDFSSSDLSNETDDSSHLNLRTRTILRPMDALSDTSDGEGEPVLEPVSRRTRSSRSRSIDVVPRVNGSTVTRTVTSYTTTRTLHSGLDVDSDVDDGTESTVPQRATPFTARSGTPLARSVTPVSRANSRSSVTSDAVGRGYTLAKGAIAEDVEEEEEAENDSMLSWRILTWRSVKRITTYVTTSVVMMAVKTVMAQQSDTASAASSEKLSRYSFLSSVSSSSRRVVDAGAGLLAASRDHLRKRPVLLWIPLIPLLIFLAFATWWLLQSGAKTDDSADPTQTTDGPSFLSYALISASELTNLVINGIYYGPILAWEAILGLGGWVISVTTGSLSALWAVVTSMAMWLGSVMHSGLAYTLQTIYLILELLQITALAVASFFSSSFSYVFGFLLPANASEEGAGGSEAQSWSASAWVASASGLSWVSQVYAGVSEAAHRTQMWIWDGWLWLVISVADALTAGVSSVLWFVGFLWSLLCLMVSGLWTVLVYIFTGTTGLLSSAATTVTSAVVEVFSTVVAASKLVFLPLAKTSGSSKNEHNTVFESHSATVESPKVSVDGMSIEDIVSRVLESTQLRGLITSVYTQNTDKSQATSEEINLLVKSLVEGELRGHKAEAAALWESHTKAAALEMETHTLSVKEQQQDFLKQLGLLGAEVSRLQESMKVSQQDQDQDQHHLETLHSQIDKLALQLQELEKNHTSLASEVKSCCKNASVTLADVERHVTALLGDILGLSSGHDGAAGGSWSVADMGAWLRSYFVAKEELETRLGTLTATLHKKSIEDNNMKESSVAASNAAIAQSTQIIMDTVLEKLRTEIHKQHQDLGEATSQQVSQQVNTQMQAAAAVLGKQMSEQVEQQLQSSKQQLKHSVSIAVEEAVSKHVASAVPEAVISAVSEAVAESVPTAVSSAVPGIVNAAVEVAVENAVNTAVDAAVPEAIAAAVPKAVKVAVPGVVTEAVANAVPQAVEVALPGTVNAAVQEAVATEVQVAITGAVSEVVASVLPSAVSTAVNETVASRISEALVDARLSSVSDGLGEEMSGEGMVVVSGTHSDLSSSRGGATLSATVNVSNNGNNGSNLFAPIALTGGLNESAVIRIVKEALLKYDADKTGMVDHALESAGGNIVSTRCTESYQVHVAELSILGIPLFNYPTNNNPRTIIQPERMPGQCWAFKGSQGYIVIRLAGSVLPTGFTIEHIPKSLSPSGEIDSAPREFEVWGLQSENDEGTLLGNYEYDHTGDPFQFFAVKEANTDYFPLIELKINSNHGNLQYTCLYRFRVHGVRHF